MTGRVHAAFGIVATVVVAATVGWGFFLVGSPATRRIERFDEQRLADLQTIAREIQFLVVDPENNDKLKQALPPTLEEAASRARSQRVPRRDPETGEAYDYRVVNESTFELCATFSQPRDADHGVFWNHPAGAHCFTIDVLDPPPF